MNFRGFNIVSRNLKSESDKMSSKFNARFARDSKSQAKKGKGSVHQIVIGALDATFKREELENDGVVIQSGHQFRPVCVVVKGRTIYERLGNKNSGFVDCSTFDPNSWKSLVCWANKRMNEVVLAASLSVVCPPSKCSDEKTSSYSSSSSSSSSSSASSSSYLSSSAALSK